VEPASDAALTPPPLPPPRLAQVEVCDAEGRCVQLFDVRQWPLRIGRALDNDLVLADPHVAAHHATLELLADGALQLRVGNSRNGARMEPGRGRLTLAAGEQATLPRGARCQLGHSLLRVRRNDDPLADELPLAVATPPAPHWWTPALGAALLGWWLGSLWLQNTPDGKLLDYLAPTLAAVGALGAWVFGWGLASKLFTGRFVVAPHLRLVLAFALALGALDLLLASVAFALDWPLASAVRPLASTALGAALVAQHLALVVPQRMRWVRAGVAALVVIGLAVQMVTQWQRNDRLLPELYASTLMPPALRLVRGTPVAQWVLELRSLEQPLRERALKAQSEDFEP